MREDVSFVDDLICCINTGLAHDSVLVRIRAAWVAGAMANCSFNAFECKQCHVAGNMMDALARAKEEGKSDGYDVQTLGQQLLSSLVNACKDGDKVYWSLMRP
jgi:hypothetical protein